MRRAVLRIVEWLYLCVVFFASGWVAMWILSLLGYPGDDRGAALNFASAWIPGFLFGLTFGWIHFENRSTALTYACIASIANLIANYVGFELGSWFELVATTHQHMLRTGLVAGMIGAFLLGRPASLFADRTHPIWFDALLIVVGGFAGVVYGEILFAAGLGSKWQWFSTGVWQATVGVTLSWHMFSQPRTTLLSSFEDRLNRFLQGPVVSLLGVIGFIYSVIDVLASKQA